MANRIDSLIIPNRSAKSSSHRQLGHGGLRHPRHIARFTRCTECSIVKETEDGRLKLEEHCKSSRRHILKKTENRKFRHGIQKETKELIEESYNCIEQ